MYQADADEAMKGFKRLAVRMLLQAAEDIAKGRQKGADRSDKLTKSRHYDSSMHWLNMNTDAAVPFDYCCDILDYEPARVRDKILSDPQGFVDGLRRNKAVPEETEDEAGVLNDAVHSAQDAPAARVVFRA